eukprot:TRINITY_DN22436_c0_g1_i1.p1 TRINITY_DN22436_c0_g1~~TRINITY_DN22436_c0_g1_i1.p1  ORF type:complete len:653 (+),score=107.43 TRINITY_DN22436_c0_g1_i1:52-2010(+)
MGDVYSFFFQAEDGIRDAQESRGLGDVYKRQVSTQSTGGQLTMAQPVFLLVCATILIRAEATVTLSVAALQMNENTPRPERLLVASQNMAAARALGADVCVLPEAWLASADMVPALQQAARRHSIAVLATYLDRGSSCASLVNRTGHVVLGYSKRASTATSPSAGPVSNVATLHTPQGSVAVGIMLGSEHLFPEVARVLMLRGAETVLVSASGILNIVDTHALQTRAFTNAMALVISNYAAGAAPSTPSNGHSSVVPFCGYWNYSIPEYPAPRCPLPRLAGSSEEILVDILDIAALRVFRVRNYLGDMVRRPFSYQSLCYPSARPTSPSPSVDQGPLVVKVGLLQMRAIRTENPVPAHQAKGEAFCRQAKAQGADVVVFPEMWSVGYGANFPSAKVGLNSSTSTPLYEWLQHAQPVDGGYVTHFRALARELGMAIAATFLHASQDGSPPRNSVAMIDRFGEILYVYSKIHTAYWSDVEVLTSSGRSTFAAVLNTAAGNVTVGSMICADREHPETARMCMLQGTELLLAPTACWFPPSQTVMNEFATRAMENVMAAATANYAHDDTMGLNGNSAGIDHTGQPVAPMGDSEEGVVLTEFDIGALRALRRSKRGVAMTKPTLHPELCNVPKAIEFRTPGRMPHDDGWAARMHDAL